MEVHVNPIKKWGVLVTLSLALFIIILDSTILNVSMAYVVKDLNTDLKTIQWATTLYSLIVAALTITGGRLGDLFGRKKMFVIGAVIFALGSFMVSISNSATMLITSMALIEGTGAALMMPATASLLVSTFKGRERAIAFGVWGGIAGAAAAFGPIVGGLITTNYTWHWAFRINVIVTLVLIAGAFLIKEVKDKYHKPQLDIVGVILSAVGMATLVYGIIESSTFGWLQAKMPYEIFGNSYDLLGLSITPYAIIFGLIIIGLFILWERKRENDGQQPLISMHIFQNKQFVSGSVTTAIMALGQAGLIFSIPVFYQAVKGKDALGTGLSLLPMSLSLLIAAPLSGALSKKVKPRVLVQIGLVFNIIGSFLLYLGLNVNSDVLQFAPGQILFGIGFGLISAQITNITLSAVDIKYAGEASGLNSTIRQLGASLGSAIIGAVFLAGFTSSMMNGINNSSVISAEQKTEYAADVEKNPSKYQYFQAQMAKNMPENVASDIVFERNQATVDAGKSAQVVAIIVSVLALAVSFSLPNTKNIHKEEVPGME
ncbi:MAG: MFS transporter [bacterium]